MCCILICKYGVVCGPQWACVLFVFAFETSKTYLLLCAYSSCVSKIYIICTFKLSFVSGTNMLVY